MRLILLKDFSEAKTLEIKSMTSSDFMIKGTPIMSPELKLNLEFLDVDKDTFTID